VSGFRGGPWEHADHHGLHDDDHLEPAGHGGRVTPVAAVVGALVLAAACLLLAADRLAAADFGTALRARTCDVSPLPGLGLLLAAGALLAVTAALQVRLTRPGVHLHFDGGALGWTLPVPALLLAATLPGVLGCRAATRFDDVPLLGDALVGMSGTMVAAAAAVLVGVAIGSAWRGEATVVVGGAHADATTVVIEEAIADAHDPHTGRFRGVDG